MKKLLLLLCICSLSNNISAQLKGRVVEKTNDKKEVSAIPGVIVYWHGTSVASTTDDKGLFSLPIVPSTNKLLVRAIGYAADTIFIKDTTKFISIRLKSGLDLNEVEVVYETKATSISFLNPIKLETLNEKYLMKAACCNLSESFETNPSVDISFADAVSGTKQIQMLGLSGKYAQITKENMPYMRGLAGAYGLNFIPGTWIQSIQLSKGAGSVVNGYESFTGQINTELQNPETSDKLHFNTYVNQNARNEYNINLKHRFNEKFAVGLLNHVSYNPIKQDLNNDGFLDIPSGKQYNFLNKYSINTGKGFEAQIGGAYLQDSREGGQTSLSTSNKIAEDSLYKLSIENKKWELYSKTGYVFRKKPGTSTGLQLSYLNHDQKNRYGFSEYKGLQKTFYANYIFQGLIKSSTHGYKVGASFLNDSINESFATLKYQRLEQDIGVFTEYALNIKDRFNMVAGFRADYHNIYRLFFTPRLHIRYAFNTNSILRFSGGKALKTANILSENMNLMPTSRNWIIETSNLNTPYGLNPEIGWNYGLNYTHKLSLNYREAYFTIDLYRTDFKDQIVVDLDFNPQQVWLYNLKGVSFSNTAQFEFGWEVRKRLNIKTAYRYVESKTSYKSGLLQVPLISIHRGFLNLSYETKNKHWLMDGTIQYNGQKRLPSTKVNPAEYQRENYSPNFYQLLGQITYVAKIRQADFHVYLGIENALNYKQSNPIVSSSSAYGPYFDASMIWGPIYGRMLYAGLRYKIK
ncbi:MAG: carboxypeptidase-like regulatory domain-containing protein [Sphingobacteriaceae bacterium]|nr:carboxypeptidase-like regulatory domain-containing protein [Sphingobacteriaceae bacterium]MBK7816746.1 carboxypeptidase-like regulatory domain-containing protein [Sphingobacteriaceae bacterium]